MDDRRSVYGPRGCKARRRDGQLCGNQAIAGTHNCRIHPGKKLAVLKAEGQVVTELLSWGLSGEKLRDPGTTLLQLMTQSAIRCELYGRLLGEAYEAAQRLQGAGDVGELPPSVDSAADRDRAVQDLQRIFATGGVGSLIGYSYAADKEGGVFATGEAIRGLVQLEAQERDRCAGMATKAIAAGLAERQVRVAERQGEMVATALRAALTDLGHNPDDPAVVRIVSTRLAALAEAAA